MSGAPLDERQVEARPVSRTGSDPSVLGPYRLLYELASGGMGTVYLARDERVPGFERIVALKRIHPHLSRQPQMVQMFLDEARIASLIRHANVCGVEDFGEWHGTTYLTMKYLVAEPLWRVIGELRRRRAELFGPRYFALAARILADVAEGLHAAHELTDARGTPLSLIHRDVSPPNLLLGYDGVVSVLDFGVAKAAQRLQESTVQGLKGKHAYMAPEQIAEASIDRRVDLWALGVVAFELLTLKRLFQRDSPLETLRAITEDPLPLASELEPSLPPELDAIVQRALQRDPEDRYPTAREMGRELVSYLSDSGQAVGLADLAEWLETLFPGERLKKLALVERALREDLSPPAVPSGGGDRTLSPVVAPLELKTAPLAPKPRRWAPWLVLLFLSTVLLTVWRGWREPGPLAPPVATEPAPLPKAEAEGRPQLGPSVELQKGEAPAVEAPAAKIEVQRPEPHRGATPSRSKHHARGASSAAPLSSSGAVGTLNVVTSGGWAKVFADGRLLGSTPLRATLPAGKHQLEIEPELGPRRKLAVEVSAGQVSRVALDLNGP